MSRRRKTIAATMLLLWSTAASAQIDANLLRIIKQEAKDLCLVPRQTGSTRQDEYGASVGASITGLLRKLVGINANVEAKTTRSQFSNVLQRDLQREHENYRKCVQVIFVQMANNVTLAGSAPRAQRATGRMASQASSSTALPKGQARRPASVGRASSSPGSGVAEAGGGGRSQSGNLCARYARFGASGWRERYLGEATLGSYHVFVQSLGPGSTEEQAVQRAGWFQDRFPNFDFKVMPTVAPDGTSNYQWAIVVAEGLPERTTAQEIVRVAKACGIAPDAYLYRQTL